MTDRGPSTLETISPSGGRVERLHRVPWRGPSPRDRRTVRRCRVTTSPAFATDAIHLLNATRSTLASTMLPSFAERVYITIAPAADVGVL